MQTKELVSRLNRCILFGKLPEIWLLQSALSYADSMQNMRITTEEKFACKPTD